ncbi:tRNA pseudouridine(55) synthase TruB [Paenibacillus sp. J45TS6]|uniref:tRNA pseudouridine(55) synthase TruB n=1 Tax=unclassified Paenibacillus TaxID=185978 RepID=UPI001B0981A9|nr:tRNA pseudouridine(55) synthase TruB [Paenibacillus sp. J45TS6]GIP43785.1 tRNA pseudouridine(55) synthase TruB [Paenibacillus sp. J45TS6]
MSGYEGVLPVLKPAGFTSHDVVAKLRGILKMKRIGHTGTLDPQVTGVLPLCLGKATRVVEYLQELPKEYHATLRLGIATDTEDMTGEVTAQVDDVQVTYEQVEAALQQFNGVISQVPPMYSAVKINGKRLYEIAREGKTVERKSREVTIHELELIRMEDVDGLPEISFRVLCSKGTYIRTLCVDIGEALGYPSTMVKLERTMSAGIPAGRCLTIEEIQQCVENDTLSKYLIPTDQSIWNFPSHTIESEQERSVLQGKKVSASYVQPALKEEGLFRLYSKEEQFLGIYQWDAESDTITPKKVFLPEPS